MNARVSAALLVAFIITLVSPGQAHALRAGSSMDDRDSDVHAGLEEGLRRGATRKLGLEPLEPRTLLAVDGVLPDPPDFLPQDVNRSGFVQAEGEAPRLRVGDLGPNGFFLGDINGDNKVTVEGDLKPLGAHLNGEMLLEGPALGRAEEIVGPVRPQTLLALANYLNAHLVGIGGGNYTAFQVDTRTPDVISTVFLKLFPRAHPEIDRFIDGNRYIVHLDTGEVVQIDQDPTDSFDPSASFRFTTRHLYPGDEGYSDAINGSLGHIENIVQGASFPKDARLTRERLRTFRDLPPGEIGQGLRVNGQVSINTLTVTRSAKDGQEGRLITIQSGDSTYTLDTKTGELRSSIGEFPDPAEVPGSWPERFRQARGPIEREREAVFGPERRFLNGVLTDMRRQEGVTVEVVTPIQVSESYKPSVTVRIYANGLIGVTTGQGLNPDGSDDGIETVWNRQSGVVSFRAFPSNYGATFRASEPAERGSYIERLRVTLDGVSRALQWNPHVSSIPDHPTLAEVAGALDDEIGDPRRKVGERNPNGSIVGNVGEELSNKDNQRRVGWHDLELVLDHVSGDRPLEGPRLTRAQQIRGDQEVGPLTAKALIEYLRENPPPPGRVGKLRISRNEDGSFHFTELGDLDGSGQVGPEDARAAADHVSGQTLLTGSALIRALEVEGGPEVTPGTVRRIVNHLNNHPNAAATAGEGEAPAPAAVDALFGQVGEAEDSGYDVIVERTAGQIIVTDRYRNPDSKAQGVQTSDEVYSVDEAGGAVTFVRRIETLVGEDLRVEETFRRTFQPREPGHDFILGRAVFVSRRLQPPVGVIRSLFNNQYGAPHQAGVGTFRIGVPVLSSTSARIMDTLNPDEITLTGSFQPFAGVVDFGYSSARINEESGEIRTMEWDARGHRVHGTVVDTITEMLIRPGEDGYLNLLDGMITGSLEMWRDLLGPQPDLRASLQTGEARLREIRERFEGVGVRVPVGARDPTTGRLVGDTNKDGTIGPADARGIVNYLNRVLRYPDVDPQGRGSPLDVNRDGIVSPGDVLLIINHLNQKYAQGFTVDVHVTPFGGRNDLNPFYRVERSPGDRYTVASSDAPLQTRPDRGTYRTYVAGESPRVEVDYRGPSTPQSPDEVYAAADQGVKYLEELGRMLVDARAALEALNHPLNAPADPDRVGQVESVIAVLELAVAKAGAAAEGEALAVDAVFGQVGAVELRAAERELIIESWRGVFFTPASPEVSQPIVPIFYDPSTFGAVPMVAQTGTGFKVFAESPEAAANLEGILDGMKVPKAQYEIRVVDPGTARAAAEQAEARLQGYRPYRVDPAEDWIDRLLAELEKDGIFVLSVDEVLPLLSQTGQYLGVQA